jgi:RimJ/RimL family protein N-acetyltransferase
MVIYFVRRKKSIADCLYDNIGSQKVLEKAGFEKYKVDEELIYWRVRKSR